jgi:phage-related protein
MTSVGAGVREIRIRDQNGIFRVIYATKMGKKIYVLHCFQKKSQRTSLADLRLAQQRYRELAQEYAQ